MARWISAGVLVIAGCGFQAAAAQQAAPAIDGPLEPTGGLATADDVVHVSSADEYTGLGDLTIAVSIAIDTDAMALGMTLPAGTTFATAQQDGGGPELAVLHVRALAVHAQVRAYGSRPLVVLADSFELTETIDVSAHGDRPGPGARSARDLEGDGTGALVGGAPGSAMAAPPCQADLPGAGGGALEIYARTRISISGYVYADGGAGIAGTCPGRMIATQPDGSGGTIVLQSPVIDNSGRLSATGAPGSDPRGGAPGSDGDGQIIMLFKAKLAAGVTTPLALTQRY